MDAGVELQPQLDRFSRPDILKLFAIGIGDSRRVRLHGSSRVPVCLRRRTGPGLAIVRHIVEHSGTVRATSDGPGTGATFIVELPAPEVT